MAEQILNTRIQLKYDTLANWNASTFKLKAGELAIVTLGEVKDGTTAGDVNQHPVLFKVGTGNHTFSQLPFASALAADVYAWAKAADVKLEGKVLKFVNASGAEIKSVTFDYITDSEATTKINNALKSYSTTEQMKAAIEVETERAQEAEKALGERIDGFNLPDGGFASQTDFAALKSKVEDEDGALAKANSAYELASGKVDKVTGKSLVSDTEITKLAGVSTGANKVEKSNTNGNIKIDGTEVNVYTLPELDTEDIAGLTEALADAKAPGTDAQSRVGVLETTVNETLTPKVNTLIGSDTGKSARTIANEELAKQLIPENASESLDTLAEIAAWIQDHPDDASAMNAAITALQNQMEGIDAGDGTVKKYVDDAITALKIGDYAKASDLTALAGRVGILEGKAGLDKVGTVTSITAGDGLTGGTINESGTIALNDATKASLALADTSIQQKDIDALALGTMSKETATNYIKKTEASGYDDILTKTVAASTYQPKGSYATAAQGTKADTALQEITTTANGGLKVTNKNQIDIDTAVTFVFNCGSATTLID